MNSANVSSSQMKIKNDAYSCPHSVHIANINVMRHEIARLNSIISKGCMNDRYEEKGKKLEKVNGTKFIKGRHPLIKDGLGYNKESKSNGRFYHKGVECVVFERKKRNGTIRPE
jgi:hypothetical protein